MVYAFSQWSIDVFGHFLDEVKLSCRQHKSGKLKSLPLTDTLDFSKKKKTQFSQIDLLPGNFRSWACHIIPLTMFNPNPGAKPVCTFGNYEVFSGLTIKK